MEERADVVVDAALLGQPRPEHQDAPQAVDHRRDGGQQVDEVRDRDPPPLRRQFGDEQGQAEADRDGDHQGDDRHDQRPVDERLGPEVAGGRIPPSRGDEAEALVAEGRHGLLGGGEEDEAEHDEDEEPGGQADPAERLVGQAGPAVERPFRGTPPGKDLRRSRRARRGDQAGMTSLSTCATACRLMASDSLA